MDLNKIKKILLFTGITGFVIMTMGILEFSNMAGTVIFHVDNISPDNAYEKLKRYEYELDSTAMRKIEHSLMVLDNYNSHYSVIKSNTTNKLLLITYAKDGDNTDLIIDKYGFDNGQMYYLYGMLTYDEASGMTSEVEKIFKETFNRCTRLDFKYWAGIFGNYGYLYFPEFITIIVILFAIAKAIANRKIVTERIKYAGIILCLIGLLFPICEKEEATQILFNRNYNLSSTTWIMFGWYYLIKQTFVGYLWLVTVLCCLKIQNGTITVKKTISNLTLSIITVLMFVWFYFYQGYFCEFLHNSYIKIISISTGYYFLLLGMIVIMVYNLKNLATLKNGNTNI